MLTLEQINKYQHMKFNSWRESIVWAAAIFEGEGHTSIVRDKYKNGIEYWTPIMAISNTDWEIIFEFNNITGGVGSIGGRTKIRGRKPCFAVTFNGYERCQFLAGLFWPFLTHRRQHRIIEVLTNTRTRKHRAEDFLRLSGSV